MTTMPIEYEAQRDWVVDNPLDAHDEIVRLTDQLRKLTELESETSSHPDDDEPCETCGGPGSDDYDRMLCDGCPDCHGTGQSPIKIN
jgi:hypothetical protein